MRCIATVRIVMEIKNNPFVYDNRNNTIEKIMDILFLS